MAVEKAYRMDAEAILSHRWDNGGDLWATPDKRLLKERLRKEVLSLWLL
ncbi:MAG: hypothetical protein ACLU9S_04390 [Oscillospiraceae bacterium]